MSKENAACYEDPVKVWKLKECQFSFGSWDLNPIISESLKEIVHDSMIEYVNHCDKSFGYMLETGLPEYKELLSEFFTATYGEKIESSKIFPTYGASYGWTMLMTQFLEQNDFVFFEEVTFFRVVEASKAYGLTVVSIPMDKDGINVNELEKELALCKSQSKHAKSDRKPFWGIIFLMTTCHNPLGINYSDDRCQAVVNLAKKYNVLVVTDEVYYFWQYNLPEGQNAAKKLTAYDKSANQGTGHVVCNCSLSKLLFPSLRLGWIESSPWIINQLASRPEVMSGGALNGFNQGLVAVILKHPKLQSFFKKSEEFYKNLLFMAVDYLQKHLPKEVTFRVPIGGFMLWIVMPPQCKSTTLNANLEKYGICIWPGTMFTIDGTHDNCFRICISNYNQDDMVLALNILCQEVVNLVKINSN